MRVEVTAVEIADGAREGEIARGMQAALSSFERRLESVRFRVQRGPNRHFSVLCACGLDGQTIVIECCSATLNGVVAASLRSLRHVLCGRDVRSPQSGFQSSVRGHAASGVGGASADALRWLGTSGR